MTSFERVVSTIQFKEPDRVPLFLLLSMYGAKELQISIKEYFSDPSNVVRAQLLMKDKYSIDCINSFFYAPVEIEAWGGEVIFVDDGPPNSGEPFIRNIEKINNLEVPKIENTKCLVKVLETIQRLKNEVGDSVPILGVVVSPFSLPVMQMGFEKYLNILYFKKDYFDKLMNINIEFCVSWANAQIKAGVSAICYFDPLASPTIIEKNKYISTGYQIAKKTLSRINALTAIHLASGISLPVIDEIASTGTAVVGFSNMDDLDEIKKASRNKICLLGNLNGVEMVNWNSKDVEENVKNLISKAGPGGGFILSDNHGEIPWQVPEEVLFEIADAVKRWGNYPLKWI